MGGPITLSPVFQNRTHAFPECVPSCKPIYNGLQNCNLQDLPVAGAAFSSEDLYCFCTFAWGASGYLAGNSSNLCSPSCNDKGWEDIKYQTRSLCNSTDQIARSESLSITSASGDSTWGYATLTPTMSPTSSSFTTTFSVPQVLRNGTDGADPSMPTSTSFPNDTRNFPTAPTTQSSSPSLPPFAIALIPIFIILIFGLLTWALVRRHPSIKRPFSRAFHRMSDSHSQNHTHPSFLAMLTSSLSLSHHRGRRYEMDGSDRAELETIEQPQELAGRPRRASSKNWQILRLLSFRRPRSSGPCQQQQQQDPNNRSSRQSRSTKHTRSRRPSNKTTDEERRTHAAAQTAGISDHMSFETSVMASLAAAAQADEEMKMLRAEQGRIWAEREAIEMREMDVVGRIWKREQEREEQGLGLGV